jgi:hypothetical protein
VNRDGGRRSRPLHFILLGEGRGGGRTLRTEAAQRLWRVGATASATAAPSPAMNSRRSISHPSYRFVGTLSRSGLHAKGPLPWPGEGGRMPGPASGQPPWRVFDVGAHPNAPDAQTLHETGASPLVPLARSISPSPGSPDRHASQHGRGGHRQISGRESAPAATLGECAYGCVLGNNGQSYRQWGVPDEDPDAKYGFGRRIETLPAPWRMRPARLRLGTASSRTAAADLIRL